MTTEEMAIELYKVRVGNRDMDSLYRFKSFHELSRPLQLSWIELAEYVQRLVRIAELKARIDEICKLPVVEIDSRIIIGLPAAYHSCRYDGLQKELATLEGLYE